VSNRDYRRTYRERHPERVKAQDAARYLRIRERLKLRRCLGPEKSKQAKTVAQ
jgi:hypothetical protein